MGLALSSIIYNPSFTMDFQILLQVILIQQLIEITDRRLQESSQCGLNMFEGWLVSSCIVWTLVLLHNLLNIWSFFSCLLKPKYCLQLFYTLGNVRLCVDVVRGDTLYLLLHQATLQEELEHRGVADPERIWRKGISLLRWCNIETAENQNPAARQVHNNLLQK